MKSRLRKNEVERTHRFLAENVAHTITKNANKSQHDCHSGLADGLQKREKIRTNYECASFGRIDEDLR